MVTTKLLSIITINYNDADGLNRTLASVCNQDFNEFEFIVIDGGSTDNSVEVIKKYSDRISYWVSEKDNGIYNAMNKGVKAAQGEYLLFLNSGDFLLTSDSLSYAAKNLGVEDIIFFNLKIVNDEKEVIWNLPDTLTFGHFVESSLPHPASFIRKKLFETHGFYDENLKICSDWKFFMDVICKHNCSYKHVDGLISQFNADGISSKKENKAMLENERKYVFDHYYNMFVKDYKQDIYNNYVVTNLRGSRLFNALRAFGFFKYF